MATSDVRDFRWGPPGGAPGGAETGNDFLGRVLLIMMWGKASATKESSANGVGGESFGSFTEDLEK